jgi:hypothetical protein
MKTYSLSEIKNELQFKNQKQLVELCLNLIKFKKENKEFAAYQLFDKANEQEFISSSKGEIYKMFATTSFSNWYLYKKTLRKILKATLQLIKISKDKKIEIELLICFCDNMKDYKLLGHHPVIDNMFESQIKKMNKALLGLHEDLQYEYKKEIEALNK